jgi:DNA topoisomerase VI subunit A
MIHNVPDHRVNLNTLIPMFCLVDHDPYGLGIYGVYKYGGEKSSVIERERLALPGLKYLGITSLDFEGDEGLIGLTERDRRRVEMMMQKGWVQQEPDVL